MVLETYEVFIHAIQGGILTCLVTIAIGLLWRRFVRRGK